MHKPVMVGEVMHHLVTREDGTYIDGTVGAGGHAAAILNKGEKLLGIDCDPEILSMARENLASFGVYCLLHQGSYVDLKAACQILGVREVDGILLDLGVSSLQLDRGERGFSFVQEAPLDMRMDPAAQVTAASIVNRSRREVLEKILWEFGEERFSRRIAGAIMEKRHHGAITTTTELASLVAKAIPRKAWPHKIHPATRTFQGLRIAVNHELDHLKIFLEKAPGFLTPGGRLVVISYHSLEDRLVKQSFRHWDKEGILKIITKKPLVASGEEVAQNPRARSAKMRVSEKLS